MAGRKKKNPDYDSEKLMQELLDSVTAAYADMGQADAHRPGGVSLRQIADEFDMTLLKIRKLLITAGAYSTPVSETVNRLKAEGKTIPQIMELTGLGRASVHSYLPYQRTVYNARELSLDAEHCRKYRDRKLVVQELQSNPTPDNLWRALELFENYSFLTAKGLKFCYAIKGNELLINRKKKSITRSSIDLALEKVLAADGDISGPKKLGVFGASYLYSIFIRLGLIV